jgi:radical SAM superfamily enzyme YgiQ (UPF0313 family)
MRAERVDVCQFDGAFLPALPLAAGLVISAARSEVSVRDRFRFALHTDRADPRAAASRLVGARVAAFSGYSWNWRYSLAVARRLRELDPAALVVFGGPSVPRRPDRARAFLAGHPFVDVLVRGEGEVPFRALLRVLAAGQALDRVPSLAFRRPDGSVGETPPAPRTADFSGLGSPFLDGTFDALIAHDGGPPRAAVLETNRGCPFACTFCDWGQAVHSRVNELPLDRVLAELDWVAERRIPYLYIVDANFGIRPRDPQITRRIAALHRRHGAPAFCFFHLTKNATQRNLETVVMLREAGVACQVALSEQDTDPLVLAEVRRQNIRPERSRALRRSMNDRGIPTLNELLLGLPGQSLESVRSTLVGAVSPFPGDSFFLYPVRLLENAELASPEQVERHGLLTVPVVTAEGGGVSETEDVVVATRTLPPADWRRAWRFGQLLSAAVNLRLLHLLVHHVAYTRREDLPGFVDLLLGAMESAPAGSVLSSLDGVLEGHLGAIRSGRALTRPVAGFGGAPREAHEALALTALASGERFFAELAAVTERFALPDAERAELIEYQAFVTPAPGQLPAERWFSRDWPAWDAARGLSASPPARRRVRVRRVPPEFTRGGPDEFAAGWLLASYAKVGGTVVETAPELASA